MIDARKIANAVVQGARVDSEFQSWCLNDDFEFDSELVASHPRENIKKTIVCRASGLKNIEGKRSERTM